MPLIGNVIPIELVDTAPIDLTDVLTHGEPR